GLQPDDLLPALFGCDLVSPHTGQLRGWPLNNWTCASSAQQGHRRDRSAKALTHGSTPKPHRLEDASEVPLLAREPLRTRLWRYTFRSTIFCLISAIAFAGLRCFGQALAQFMMVWQRYSRNGSSRLSSRVPVASSRESIIKRCACSSAAGPRKRSEFHQ